MRAIGRGEGGDSPLVRGFIWFGFFYNEVCVYVFFFWWVFTRGGLFVRKKWDSDQSNENFTLRSNPNIPLPFLCS